MNEAVSTPSVQGQRTTGPAAGLVALALAGVLVLVQCDAGANTLTNVALGKNAFASSTYTPTGMYPELAVDGNPDHPSQWAGTRHASVNRPEWLIVDLGGIYNVDNVTLRYGPCGRGYEGLDNDYELHTSLDGVTWTNHASGTLVECYHIVDVVHPANAYLGLAP